ncbi:hypothetical protein [Flavobacterium restrictum]|uniref:Uncharacterized protein n=1 Tax=Flavobacterium restrictum TaxID=2594428 RepID=A0A553E433_9FLAO|nr:hypothetical protein [Flavobacterium restrictum]TRX39787.1 hypothetical protein FNW21_08765 [Flavobacterium restrictum]
MKSTYSLLSEKEPTEKELHYLMENVLKEVKIRASISSQKLEALQLLQIDEAFEKHKVYKIKNDQK